MKPRDDTSNEIQQKDHKFNSFHDSVMTIPRYSEILKCQKNGILLNIF